MVAASVAARCDDVAALILLGAPALAGSKVWVDQQMVGTAAHLERDTADLRDVRAILERVVALSASGGDSDAIEQAGIDLFTRVGIDLDEARTSGLLAGFVERLSSPWFRYFLRHDPAGDYRAVRVPVLALYGALDNLTAPALNGPALESALNASGSADLVLRVVEDQDHFFLRGDGLPPGTHRFRQMHVAPDLLREMTAWLDERF
jgi:uncharacterized protein